MKATQTLHDLGQSIWLDNITRDLLTTGTLKHYINELSVTGLTSNPSIFDHAIKSRLAYDAAIRNRLKQGLSGEELFFDLALDDITQAADLSVRLTSELVASTDSCRWRFRRGSRTIPGPRWRRLKTFMRAPDGRTYSSRSWAPSKVFRPSRRPSLPAFRST